MAQNRAPREVDSRSESEHDEPWTPPSVLPEPHPQPGWRFHWVRTSTLGESDNKNVSQRFREGWEPCKAEDYPELCLVMSDHGSDWAKKGAIEVGGLLLCKAPDEKMAQRNRYYESAAENQMESVDSQLMAHSDPRMPLLRPERKTSFGSGVG